MVKLEKKYGLITAICMVVGIVIGSGVFFKAQSILTMTNGDMKLGILAWIIGGAIMIVCVLAFATMARKYSKVNGIVDYAEATVSKRYAYNIGWFLSTIYYPALTGVLAWLSARYTFVFLASINPDIPLSIPISEGGLVKSPEVIILMLVYLLGAYLVNALSPKLAGRFQVSTTIIKMIPLLLMAIVGLGYGLMHGVTSANLQSATTPIALSSNNTLFSAIVATAFAYEGWIIATSINAELKDSKRNLPKALIIGGIIIIVTYIFYFIGLAGAVSSQTLMEEGATFAFIKMFGPFFGNILNLFIAISCIGTMNGLMLGCVRGIYSVSLRTSSDKLKMFSEIDPITNIPTNSGVVGLFLSGVWALYFFIAILNPNPSAYLGGFVFDSSEISIITVYALYLPIFVNFMRKGKEFSVLKRFIIPSLAFVGSVFMIVASIYAHGMGNLYYLIVFSIIMIIGNTLYK